MPSADDNIWLDEPIDTEGSKEWLDLQWLEMLRCGPNDGAQRNIMSPWYWFEALMQSVLG